MKQSFFLAWAGLKGRKRSTALLLSTIVLAVAFLVVMGLIGSSSLYTMDNRKKDLYGEQKLVAWNLTKEQKEYFENSAVWDEIGKITVYGTVASVSGTVIGIGTMDAEAVRLGHIRLAEGRLAQAADEVVAEKGVYRYVGGEAYAVGDEIELEVMEFGEKAPRRKRFRVVGIMEDYSAVWRKAYAGQDGNVGAVVVSFWVGDMAVDFRDASVGDIAGDEGLGGGAAADMAGDEDLGGSVAADMANGLGSAADQTMGLTGNVAETWLLNSPSDSYHVLHENLPEKATLRFNYSVYPQIGYYGGMGEEALGTLQLSALIGGVFLACMAAVLLNGFLMSVERRKRQLSLLRCIGATKKQAQTCLLCEALILLAAGIPTGLVLGVLGSFGAVRGFSALGGTEIVYHFNAWVLAAAVFLCVLCVCLAVWLPAVRASKVAPVAGTRTVSFQRKAGRVAQSGAGLGPFGLMLISMKKEKGKTVLTAVTFALVMVSFHVMMMTDLVEYRSEEPYRRADAQLTAPEELGKAASGFGSVEFFAPEGEAEEGDLTGGGDYGENRAKTAAIPASVFSDFRNCADVAYQNASVLPMFYCRIPFSRYDSYLNGHFHFDYKMLGLQNWEIWGQYHYSFAEQMRCGYRGQEYLISPEITVFDDFLLEQFGAYVADGDVDTEAIRRGEEIILCMPDYDLVVREEGNGVQFQEQIVGKTADAFKDARRLTNTGWAAGDALTFTWAKRQGEGYVLYERTVKIGAVVKGAPQVEGAFGGIFSIAVGEDTLENLEVPYEIFKVYISFGEDADLAAAEADLGRMVAQGYPLAKWSVRTEEALAERQQRNLRLAVSGMITVCLFVMGFFGLVNTVSGRVYGRLHEIGLLRCIGMTKGQVYRMFVYEGCVFGCVAAGIGMAVSLVILGKYQENWWDTQMVGYMGMSCLGCVAVSVAVALWTVRAAMEKGVAEIVREEG